MDFQRCKVCEWRRRLIAASNDDDTVAPLWACDSLHPMILEGLHLMPGQTWIDIISTGRLCVPSMPVCRQGRKWLCIPLRCETTVQSSDCTYCYDGCWKAPDETVVGFHNTRLESLVQATPSWTGTPNGHGILVDGRLRYGTCSHNGNIGVNVYSDGGLDTFAGSTGWVQLELRCTNTTKLKGGAPNRYCINGPSGYSCYKAAIFALWVLWDDQHDCMMMQWCYKARASKRAAPLPARLVKPKPAPGSLSSPSGAPEHTGDFDVGEQSARALRRDQAPLEREPRDALPLMGLTAEDDQSFFCLCFFMFGLLLQSMGLASRQRTPPMHHR